ncbi:hypothetical protein BJY01DRAFT_226735 [Aspergillus pseudoustus]|uniref:Uncharacterized protein n=1 Tax=Aspergillus pseudoustus TaxID=1810923 RepID=A0ABR4IWS4_9EURO
MHPTTTSLPANSAPATEVRSYITQTLVTRHKVDPDVAEEHAAKWDVGRGFELKQASLGHLQRVFGDNVGLSLYHVVRVDEAAEPRTRVEVLSTAAADITGLLLVGVLALRFVPTALGLRDRNNPIMWAANPLWWLLFAACAFNAAYQGQLQDAKSAFMLIGGVLAISVGVPLSA